MNRFVVLLRAVNVGGRKLPMADLRAAAAEAGFERFGTHIQSGNLVLSAPGDAASVEAALEALIERRYGFRSEAMARTVRDFALLAASNPFPDADPKRLQLCLTKRPPLSEAPGRIAERARHGERAALAGGAIWIDFAGGIGDSKLTPAFLDKAAGSPLTARNWNTVQKLIEMSGE